MALVVYSIIAFQPPLARFKSGYDETSSTINKLTQPFLHNNHSRENHKINPHAMLTLYYFTPEIFDVKPDSIKTVKD